VAEANMQPSQIQDLAEIMGQIISIVGEHEIKFILKIEADKNIPEESLSKLNELLAEVNNLIKLK
jgi:hypothetical protein